MLTPDVTALLLVVFAAMSQAPPPAFSRLSAGTDSMSITVVQNGAPTLVGELWDQITPVEINGARGLRRVYRTVNRLFGPHLESTFVRLPDLRPIKQRTYAQLTADSAVVTGDSVRGWRQEAQGGRVAIARALRSGVIDASMFDAAIRAAPLAPGYALTLQGYSAAQDSVLELRARVTGSATLTQRNGERVDTWVVAIDFGGLKSTLWIAQSSRALVRQTIQLAPQVEMLMQR